MRKKSHISLAKYIMQSPGMEALELHKKAFYIGSILPDCTPAFLTRRHCIEDTFDILKKEIRKITEDYDSEKGISMYFCRHLGVITHYLADYFTFPHNSIYDGTIKEHCKYEKQLKGAFKQYVKSEDARKERKELGDIPSVNEICELIEETHEEYLCAVKAVKIDCEYIVNLCHCVVDAILWFFEAAFRNLKELETVFT